MRITLYASCRCCRSSQARTSRSAPGPSPVRVVGPLCQHASSPRFGIRAKSADLQACAGRCRRASRWVAPQNRLPSSPTASASTRPAVYLSMALWPARAGPRHSQAAVAPAAQAFLALMLRSFRRDLTAHGARLHRSKLELVEGRIPIPRLVAARLPPHEALLVANHGGNSAPAAARIDWCALDALLAPVSLDSPPPYGGANTLRKREAWQTRAHRRCRDAEDLDNAGDSHSRANQFCAGTGGGCLLRHHSQTNSPQISPCSRETCRSTGGRVVVSARTQCTKFFHHQEPPQ